MQVAEETHEAAIGITVQKDLRLLWLGSVALGPYRGAGFIGGEEVFAVELERHAFLAGEHRVGLRSGRDQHRASGKLDFLSLHGELHRARVPILVDFDAARRQPFGKRDAFFQRLFDLLVIKRVRGTVDHAASVGDRRAAPALEQCEPLFRLGGTQGARVRQKLLRDGAFLGVPRRGLLAERFVARQEFVHLNRVIGE